MIIATRCDDSRSAAMVAIESGLSGHESTRKPANVSCDSAAARDTLRTCAADATVDDRSLKASASTR